LPTCNGIDVIRDEPAGTHTSRPNLKFGESFKLTNARIIAGWSDGLLTITRTTPHRPGAKLRNPIAEPTVGTDNSPSLADRCWAIAKAPGTKVPGTKASDTRAMRIAPNLPTRTTEKMLAKASISEYTGSSAG
jgi:hypothetical protein